MSRRTFFITGSNSGFGLAIATAAVAAGNTVIGTVRSEASAAKLRGIVPAVHPVLCDVTEFSRIPGLIERVEDEHGPVDVLINNAGYGHEGVLEESPLEEMRRQFDVNVFGAVAVAKAFLPRFRQRRRGFIVNVTSMGGMITMPRYRLLLREQVCSAGHIGGHAFGNGSFRRSCDDTLPRLLQDGLGRAFNDSH